MLGSAKSISRSIELFVNEIADSLKFLSVDKEFSQSISKIENGENVSSYNEKLKAYYESQKKSIYALYFFDKNGRTLTQYPINIENANIGLNTDIELVLIEKKARIGKTYFDGDKNGFVLNLYEPVFDGGEFKGIISVVVGLNGIYDRLISPIKIGEKGYAMVKDQDGTIIMHPVKEQVGIDVIETRKEMHPELDFKELETLIDNQLTGKEGTAIYHSYWWGDNVLKKVKKLSAYTPVKLGDYFWVVALTMSYDEIQGPINKFLAIIIIVASLIVVIIYGFISVLVKVKKNKEELEKETKYLRMLNEASEELRKQEAELYHSQKLKVIGTLASAIAHDINNLLSPILGYSELLLMRIPKNSEYYDEAYEISLASQRGKDLVEQLLAFSKSENDIVKVELISINEVVEEAINLLKVVVPKNVDIIENIKANCGYIKANFTQIHQVVFNLCTNAYQAIKDNRGNIQVSLSVIKGKDFEDLLDEEKNYIKLEIKDTGCGMDEETKEKIFNPYFTTKAMEEGTGLGLFVVKSIIDKYEGIIKVESEVLIGSIFTIYLPQIKE